MIKKRLIVLALFSVLILPVFVSAQTAGALQRGSTGGSVTELQNILKTDRSVYPEGLATGYFGPATENAVKRLQTKYGLPQTGVIDSATTAIIFPSNVQLKVLSPNGGEVWDKSQPHQILWQVTVAPIVYDSNTKSWIPTTPGTFGTNGAPASQFQPFFHNLSIDLIEDSNPNFFYHVGTTDLYQTQFNWSIPSSLQNASDYRVKISVGGQVPCLEQNSGLRACPMYYPQYSYSDTSDNPFSITGSYPDDTLAKIKTMLDQIQQQINSLQNQLNSLRQLVNSL